jgi:hypothetical protein
MVGAERDSLLGDASDLIQTTRRIKMKKFDPQETLKRIQERRAKHRNRQNEKTISGISPEVIEAVRNLDKLKSISKNEEKGVALFGPHKDFLSMMDEYKRIHGCTGPEAYMAIARAHPESLERCIKEAKS